MLHRYQMCLTLFLAVLIVETLSSTIQDSRLASAPPRNMRKLSYSRTDGQDFGSNNYEYGSVSEKFVATQSIALQPLPLPMPPQKDKPTTETEIQEKGRVITLGLGESSPTKSTTTRTTAISTDFQFIIHTFASPNLLVQFEPNDTSESSSTPHIPIAPLELPLPSLLPLIPTSPTTRADVEPVLVQRSLSVTFTLSMPSKSREAYAMVGIERRKLVRRQDEKTPGGTLCSRCKNRSDCRGEYLCKEWFCVRSRGELERCERRIHCAPCGKGLPHCGKHAGCIKGVCMIEGQPGDACRRLGRRAVRKIHKKQFAKFRKHRNREVAVSLCDPCLYQAHCRGARICSPGKPCRSLKCRVGFCSTSVRMSVRLCAKIDDI